MDDGLGVRWRVGANNIVAALVLIPRNPGLLADRALSEGPRDLDRVLAGTMALFGPLATLVVAGLDFRFAWSPRIALVIQIGTVAIAVLGAMLTIWPMASNRHSYGVARINRKDMPSPCLGTIGSYAILATLVQFYSNWPCRWCLARCGRSSH